MDTSTNSHEGRFTVEEAFDYAEVREVIPAFEGDVPAFGVLDHESGQFIAFSKNEEGAERVVKALRILTEFAESGDADRLYRFAISERQQIGKPTEMYEFGWVRYLDAIIAVTNPYTTIEVGEKKKKKGS